MMFKISEEDKRVLQREGGELEKLWNENPTRNQHYSSLFHLLHPPHQHHLLGGSPVSRASLPSEFSPSSSFSNGFYSSGYGSPSPYSTPFEEAKYQTPYVNGLCLDSKPPPDDLGLAERFYRMHIGEEQENGTKRRGFERGPDGIGLGGGFFWGTSPWNAENYGLFESSKNNVSDFDGFQSAGLGGSGRFGRTMESALLGLQPKCAVGDSMGSFRNHMQPNAFYSGPSCVKRMEQGDGWYQRNPSSARSYPDEDYFCLQPRGTDSSGGKGLMYPMSSPQFPSVAKLNVDNLSHNHSMIKQRTGVNPTSGIPESFKSMNCAGDFEGYGCEDSSIMQGNHLNHAICKPSKSSKGYKKNSCTKMAMPTGEKSSRLDSDSYDGGNEWSQSDNNSFRSFISLCSLAEVQEYIYFVAKDQYGCRFLQGMLDEGTSQDLQLIFDKIINHVFELMTNPFGNYLMQKLLDVCNEQQRMQFVIKVIKEPGQLVRVSLDTHGTRVVQKLIETLKPGKQIALVKSSLECGFLDLIKDPNGNHVVQRCLDCFSDEDNKFIFDAAARYCVEIATQRHGCCVLQKCIAHAIGRHRDKLINEISRNGLLLSQDPYGNYVVQYVIELKIPSAMAKLTTQLKGNFVRLSMQKCSSHVVEKCLKYFEESRPKIIHELLSFQRFDQLLQDPYANYVIQSALGVAKGPLHAALVEAVKPHTILRTSPYCKRIFSKDLLKK
ncbi:hypothetical protein EV1_043589 [Malus domestica]|uniref:putative pumilio homolog 7, chloroplastic n=1 Tax=Malus domestica TaxID=3750 RepID=UPI0010AACF15|nr:putative pumilio homolog 7, chloroplastic [Malus domestica]